MPSEQGIDVVFERIYPYKASYTINNLNSYTDSFTAGLEVKRVPEHFQDTIALNSQGLVEKFKLNFRLIEGEFVQTFFDGVHENPTNVLVKRIFLRTHFRPYAIENQYRLTEKYPAELGIPDYVVPVMIDTGFVTFSDANRVNPVVNFDLVVANSADGGDIDGTE